MFKIQDIIFRSWPHNVPGDTLQLSIEWVTSHFRAKQSYFGACKLHHQQKTDIIRNQEKQWESRLDRWNHVVSSDGSESSRRSPNECACTFHVYFWWVKWLALSPLSGSTIRSWSCVHKHALTSKDNNNSTKESESTVISIAAKAMELHKQTRPLNVNKSTATDCFD